MNKPYSSSPQTLTDRAPDDAAATTGTTEDLISVFNYPALGRLFDERDGQESLNDMKAQLLKTNQQIERVIRQGSKEDAERAGRIAHAYAATLALLNELEQLRKTGGAQHPANAVAQKK